MKELYRVEHMTKDNFADMMTGAYLYVVNKDEVEAESIDEAIAIVKAMYPDHVINKNCVRTVAEIEAEEAEREARWAAEKAKEEAKKAAKKAFDEAHPEIVAERKRRAKINTAKRAITKAEAELAEIEEKLAYWKARLAELERGE